ncbi:hypothetical protein [uncultured Hyphomonas sp.]|uniref:hypothetical protein n=1 Tax=uncultured Hyphomonas sp. TaxID=225298 RepID=UPI002AAC0A06|nr:hypothetical protein [uncultured Hyphomonas sp.]
MKKAWILALAGSLVACGQPADAPAGGSVSAPAAEQHETLQAEVPESEPIASPYEVTESAPDDRDFAALAGYPDSWYVSYGWPGEYPAGFVVLEQGVTVNGRARPNPDAPANVACTLPQYANYQIWNQQRVERDSLEFIVASKVEPVTMLVDANIETPGDEGMQVLELKAGDVLSYLRYLGEGFAIFGFNGQEYTINEAELRDISSMSGMSLEEDQWVEVACIGGTRAWILYDDAIAHDEIVPSPIVGFGEASDIYPDEVDQVRAEGLELEAFQNGAFDEGATD